MRDEEHRLPGEYDEVLRRQRTKAYDRYGECATTASSGNARATARRFIAKFDAVRYAVLGEERDSSLPS